MYASHRTTNSRPRRWRCARAVLLAAALVGPTWAQESQPAPVTWLTTLDEGYTQARAARRPILVDVGATWCSWCRKLEREMQQAEVQSELARWTLVRLDADKSETAVRSLGVGPIPALRIVAATGQVLAAHDGYLPAPQLVAWLRQQYPSAAAIPTAELLDTAAPTGDALAALVKLLEHSDATLRESAIRRLMPHARVAAPAVVAAFERGGLALRLGTFELLSAWRGPTAEIDPWQPETITAPRLAALRTWAEDVPEAAADGRAASSATAATGSTAALDLEFNTLLRTDDVAELAAVIERLARGGGDVLPVVYERLKQCDTDRDRERLTRVRYRVVARPELALTWADGLARLAATDPTTRHAAAQELAARATAGDGPLLLELFSNPDALVREISLRALRSVGGASADEALLGLLQDPEPNVRAAVLKQLTEKPAPELIARVAEYAAGETDADLLVHAARVFRSSATEASIGALRKLLEHPNWRVRAEAAEAIGEIVRANYRMAADKKADLYVELIRRLDDEDGFVASRAVAGLADVDLIAAVEPLARVATRHPEVAPEALRLLAREELRQKALPFLREFCNSDNPATRAAAITALCQAGADGNEPELLRLLADAEPSVRRAAARALFGLLVTQRTGHAGGSGDSYTQYALKQAAGVPTTNKAPPAWTTGTIDPLVTLLGEEAPESQVAAALPLIALDHADAALPVLLEAAKANPALRPTAARAIGWLPVAQQASFQSAFVEMGADAETLGVLAHGIVGSAMKLALGATDLQLDFTSTDSQPTTQPFAPDDLLWQLLAADTSGDEVLRAINDALKRLYFGSENYYDSSRYTAAQRKRAIEAAAPRAKEGPDRQRVVALALLLDADTTRAAEAARAILDNAETSAALRADAMQILLLALPARDAERSAVEALTGADAGLRPVAVRYLTHGRTGVQSLRSSIWVSVINYNYNSNKDIKLDPPTGLTPEVLQPLLQDEQAEVAAGAAYLLALFKDRPALDTLLAYWREHAQTDDDWRRLAYRGVAAQEDSALLPVLEEIYRTFEKDDYAIRDFYWTIRNLQGPAALALRKQIRTDVGMDRLR